MKAFEESPCGSCDARCCKKYFVGVLPPEAHRISVKLKKPLGEIVQLFSSDECDSIHTPPFWVEGKEFFLGLKRANGECAFLKKGKCGIHSFKPRVCKTFPICLHTQRTGLVKNHACPKEFPETLEVAAMLEEYDNGLKLLRRDSVEWNWGTKGNATYPELLAFFKAKLVMRKKIRGIIAKHKIR